MQLPGFLRNPAPPRESGIGPGHPTGGRLGAAGGGVSYGLGARPPRAARLPRIVAAFAAASGLLSLASMVFAKEPGHLGLLFDFPLAVRSSANSATAVAGLGLLAIAGGLARRQRHAWWVALTLLLISGFGHLVKDVDVAAAGASFAVAGLLLLSRKEFDAQPGPHTFRRALVVLPLLAATVWLFGWLWIQDHSGSFAGVVSPGKAAVAALRGAVGLPLGLRTLDGARWIGDALPLLGVVFVTSALLSLFRPLIGRTQSGEVDTDHVRDLVLRYGHDTLSYFALREGKEYFVLGDAVVPYIYLWNLGLVSGDPIGATEDVPAAMTAFVDRVRSFGWGVAVLAAGDANADLYLGLGMRRFYLGDEAVIDLPSFSLEGKPVRKIRQSCHRLERLGYTLDFLRDDQVTPDLRDSLAQISRSWRGRAPERGFTMALGRPPSGRDPECLTVVARDAEGVAQGYLHLVPCSGPRPGYSIDQMRRRQGTPNGLMEWSITRSALRLRDQEFFRLSLNFAFLGGLLERPAGLTFWQRIEEAVVRPFAPFFQIESLRRFNGQFHPRWVPRYVYYEAPFSLPRVALAYLEAEAILRSPLIGVRGRLRLRIPSRLSGEKRRAARGRGAARDLSVRLRPRQGRRTADHSKRGIT